MDTAHTHILIASDNKFQCTNNMKAVSFISKVMNAAEILSYQPYLLQKIRTIPVAYGIQ